MKHRIVILGAGYAGAHVAGTLARRLTPADTEITVVNAEPDFVQRLRLHQLAAGQEIEAPLLADVFVGTGIRLRVARVTAVDPERPALGAAPARAPGQPEQAGRRRECAGRRRRVDRHRDRHRDRPIPARPVGGAGRPR